MSQFDDRVKKIVNRFLLTAVIIDDRAILSDPDEEPISSLKEPDEELPTSALEIEPRGEPIEHRRADANHLHDLDVRELVTSFAEHGIICSVMAHQKNDPLTGSFIKIAETADIVILDWELENDDGETARTILQRLLVDSDKSRLRLIAVYTGDTKLLPIASSIATHLDPVANIPDPQNYPLSISYNSSRIVVYAKPNVPVESEVADRSVSQSKFVDRLIGDFTEMTSGLLSTLALSSITAIRENTHRLLKSFSPDLDPAFLTHRASLPSPEDSQEHMLSLLQSELHAIIEDHIFYENPASMAAIKSWLTSKFDGDHEFVFGESRKLSFEDTSILLEKGIDACRSEQIGKIVNLGKHFYKHLSSGFSMGENSTNDLDHRLAWMFNFRTLRSEHPPILRLGSTLELDHAPSNSKYFICMRPWCDSQRLSKVENFLLLPLVKTDRAGTLIVLKMHDGSYSVRKISMNQSDWLLVAFEPSKSKGCVVAHKDSDDRFVFRSTILHKFFWLGELNPEFAQSVSLDFASWQSRVGLDNSEWLRRQETSNN